MGKNEIKEKVKRIWNNVDRYWHLNTFGTLEKYDGGIINSALSENLLFLIKFPSLDTPIEITFKNSIFVSQIECLFAELFNSKKTSAAITKIIVNYLEDITKPIRSMYAKINKGNCSRYFYDMRELECICNEFISTNYEIFYFILFCSLIKGGIGKENELIREMTSNIFEAVYSVYKRILQNICNDKINNKEANIVCIDELGN